MNHKKIEFEKLPITKYYGKSIYNVWHVVEDGKAIVLTNFKLLGISDQKRIKSIIGSMATIPGFENYSLRWRVHKYQYGEVKPKGHRFFFFIKYRENIVFFYYRRKKSDSLGDKTYREIDRKRKKYEKEFEKFIEGNK